ncbi:MAG: choice-of-anchor D domain-containing protein [Calditrichaeota bacterium]|nr:MAG: choice-of-anchor D domain-containing protein [Calditrichota bacterium]
MNFKYLFLLSLTFLFSCSEDKIESKPEINLNPAVLEFSDIPVTFKTSQFLTIENVGDLPLEVNSISIDSSLIFSVSNDSLPVILESGENHKIEINFTPNAVTNYEGKLSVSSNAKGGSNIMTLRGKGLAQTFLLGTEIDTLDFGTVVFPNEITKNMKVKNLGNSPVRISNIVFTPPRNFETALVTALEISNGDSSFINFTYKPQAIGQASAEMSIFSNQANPKHTVFIGNADEAFSQIISDTPNIEFEDTEIGESFSKSITLRNEGNSELLVTEIYFLNEFKGFETDAATPMSILPNESQSFNVTFLPISTNAHSDSLVIKSNSQTDSLVVIPINGFGKSKDLDLLSDWLTGSFSSEEQAQNSNDPYIFDVRMKIATIWSERKDGYWVYVEQAQFESQSSPYRQRIYHLTYENNGLFDRIYRLSNPEEFVGSWETPSDFDGLSQDDLIWAEGCDVHFIYEESKNRFLGNTKGEECLSSIPNVAYLTSETEIYDTLLTSWDLGWNSSGDTVLGPSSPYIFHKIENFENPLFNGIELNK